MTLNATFLMFFVLWSQADKWAVNRSEAHGGFDPSQLFPHGHLLGVAAHAALVALVCCDVPGVVIPTRSVRVRAALARLSEVRRPLSHNRPFALTIRTWCVRGKYESGTAWSRIAVRKLNHTHHTLTPVRTTHVFVSAVAGASRFVLSSEQSWVSELHAEQSSTDQFRLPAMVQDHRSQIERALHSDLPGKSA